MRVIAVALVFVLTSVVDCTAQEQPWTIESGARVRVSRCRSWASRSGRRQEECDRDIGSLLSIAGGVIRIRFEDGTTESEVPLDRVTRLEVHAGRRGHPWRGAAIGGVFLGVPTTYLAAVVAGAWGACEYSYACEGAEWTALGVGLLGTGAGAALGALIGQAIKTDRWEDVPLDRLRVTVVPQREGRIGLGLSVGF